MFISQTEFGAKLSDIGSWHNLYLKMSGKRFAKFNNFAANMHKQQTSLDLALTDFMHM